MKLFPAALSPTILRALPREVDTYLVGGAVRDALLNRVTHDLDFVVNGDGRRVAAAVADALGAAYYPLDDDHRTGRVVLKHPDGTRLLLDFAALRGNDLETDLRARDFTINAIAMQVPEPRRLIDPLRGGADLHSRLLVPCSPNAFQDDPLRVIRAVRLATSLKLQIPEDARIALRAAVPRLNEISAERIRDEILRLLGGRRPSSAVRALDILGILEQLMPELLAMKKIEQSPPHTADVWTHTMRVLDRLEVLLSVLGPVHDSEKGADIALGLASRQIGRFRAEIHAHVQVEFVPERPLRPLLFLAALYHDAGKPATRRAEGGDKPSFPGHADQSAELVRARAVSLRLSKQEISRLERVVRHHSWPRTLAQAVSPTAPERDLDGPEKQRIVSRLEIYRYFRETGDAGVDICLLSMADVLAIFGQTLPPDVWLTHLNVVRDLLHAWWTDRERTIDPPPLLGGQELIDRFGLAPGPEIGELLEKLREGQATGEVTSLEEAWSALATWLGIQG